MKKVYSIVTLIFLIIFNISCKKDNITSPNENQKILVLSRNKSSLDAEETKLVNFLQKNGYQYDITDASSILDLNVSNYKVIYFRTDAEPTQFNNSSILNKIRTAVENGSSLILEFYGSYLGQYLGWGNVMTGGWGPVVDDVWSFVKPITNHQIFNNLPIWDPPSLPDRNEQILGKIINKSSSITVWLDNVVDGVRLEYWHLAITYGWPYQNTNSSYCNNWGGCTGERSVHKSWVTYAQHGLGKLIVDTPGVEGTPSSRVKCELGNAGKILLNNIIKWAGGW